MNPVHFEGASEVGKPKDMTDEQCYSVWATRGFHSLLEVMDEWHDKAVPPFHANIDQSINCVYYLTAWKPSYEDLQALNRGEPVYVKTVAHGLPPMALFTLNEQGQPNQD